MSARLPFQTDGGAGAKGACGLIVLQTDETMEVEFSPLFQRAEVAIYHSRLPSAPDVSAESLAAMRDELPRAASMLPGGDMLDVIGYGCTSGATVIGPEIVAGIVRYHHPATRRVTDPITATIAALNRLGVRRIGFLTPYVAEVSAAMRALLQQHGFEITAFGSFEEANEATVARITEASLKEAICTLGRQPGVEAVFASCTNLRSFNIVEAAEAELGMPVLSSNLAFAWHLLDGAGRAGQAGGPGRLFSR